MAKKARRVKRLDSLIKSTAYDPRRDGVTQGLLMMWQKCKTLAKAYLKGWRPIGRKRSLRFGSFVHDVLRELYSYAKEAPKLAEKRRYRIVRSKTERCVKEALANREPAQEVEMDGALVTMLLRNYVDHHHDDFTKKRWINVEKTFDVPHDPLTDCRCYAVVIRRRGRRDGIYGIVKKLGLRLLETKTKSRISEDTIEDLLSFDFQNLFYVDSASTEMGKPLDGVLYNIVRVPQHKPGKNESMRSFISRIDAEVKKRPEHFFKRYEITYSKRALAHFRRELEMKLADFVVWCDEGMPAYMNEGACQGRWNCSFIPACASGRMVGFTQTGRLFEELED